MGYNTNFKGELKFAIELTNEQRKEIEKFFNEDCRDHPEWNAGNLTWMDIEYNNNKDGIQWNGSEKTYDLAEKVNIIIDRMREQWPDFNLIGYLIAQGERIDDRWVLAIENGKAVEKEIAFKSKEILCPHCNKTIYLEE